MKVIKIGAVWCSSCLVMQPRWQEIETENPWLKTEYLDYDQDENQVKAFKITSDRLPVFIFLDKKGQELTRLSGEYSKPELIKLIKQYRHK